MALKLVTPPAIEPLSVSDAKTHLRVWSGDDDAYISGLIVAARRWAETRLRRSLITTTWRETFSRLPSCGVIELSRPPLIAVTSFVYIDQAGAEQEVDDAIYEVDTDSEPGRIVRGYEKTWPIVRTTGVSAPVSVTYTAGYGGADDVPEAIKSAMKLAIGHWYDHREMVAAGSMNVLPMAADSLLATECWGSYP